MYNPEMFFDSSGDRQIRNEQLESDSNAIVEEGIVLHLADGTICACNASAQSILGLTASQMQGCSPTSCPWQTIHEDGSPFSSERHPAMVALQTGQPCDNVVMGLYKPNGELTWLLLNSQPLFRGNEIAPYGVITTFSDITEQKPQLNQLNSSCENLHVQTVHELQQRTILIIDDCLEDRETIKRYLLEDAAYKYIIIEAELGEEGLELCQQHQPDLILLDYLLPDLDGLEFAIQLQQRISLNVPVILLTGQGNESVAVQAMKSGICDYLVKGKISPEELREAVNCAIEKVQLHVRLENAETARQLQIERERIVTQIAQQVHNSLNLNEILNTTVQEVRQFLQTDRVIIFKLQPDGNGVVSTESVGVEWTPILSASIYDPCFVTSYIEPYKQGLVTAKTDIYNADIDPCHFDLLAQFQVRANLVVPILQAENLWGLLIAHHCSAPRQWQQVETDLLQQLATHVGIAIQQAELYQQAQIEIVERRQAEASLRQHLLLEQLVAQIVQHIRQSLNLEDVLNTTVSEVRQFLATDRVFIYRFQPDWSGVVVVESVGEGWLSILDVSVEDTYFVETCGEDYRQGRIQATADIYTAGLTQCHIDLLARFQVRANLAVPILQGENLWGLLVANQCSVSRQWQEIEIDLLKQLAAQLGITIQQSELYEQIQFELAERKRTEEQLRHSQQFTQQIVNTIPGVLHLYDAIAQQNVYLSSQTLELLGYPAEEILAMGTEFVPQVMHPDDIAKLPAHIETTQRILFRRNH